MSVQPASCLQSSLIVNKAIVVAADYHLERLSSGVSYVHDLSDTRYVEWSIVESITICESGRRRPAEGRASGS